VGPSFTLFRVAGIRVGVNWSWAIVFGLIVWSLADRVFPAEDPGHSAGTYTAMALVAALVFFASLLLHELGHAVRARREGVEVAGITLWLFGGVARLGGGLPGAGAELRIALSGPLVTAVLAVVFVAVALAAPLPAAVGGVLAWLGYVNVILLVFNLLPAFPLDGGRVLRAARWRSTGSLLAATRTAVRVSRVLAFLIVAGGLALVVYGDTIGGLWLAFVGWFLLQAARAESWHAYAAERWRSG
jgi:Zn-dependent protease